MKCLYVLPLLACCAWGCGSEASRTLTRTPYADVTVLEGDLQKRLLLNYDRLQQPLFRFDSMSTAFTVREAPGDWVGRDILSQSILGQVLHKQPGPVFRQIMDSIPVLLNEQGYVGSVIPDSVANEGFITGHNGFLRGLNEYYLWTRDTTTLRQIRTIVDNLFVKREPLVKEYPTSVLTAQKEGGQVGHTVNAETPSAWQGLSTDIGQFFLTLDALTQSYRIVPSPGLKQMIGEMIDKFASINFAEIGGQTHSFLGCLRGILNWYEITGETKYLEMVIQRFGLYQQLAMTENYENYNWFDRPVWTEGCAVVDAFMLAANLWRLTGNTDDLHLAHLILYNGIYANQRPNGGFGCNNCTGTDGQLCLHPANIYEAPWCCSMRGSEALVETLAATFCHDNDRIVTPFYHHTRATLHFPDGEMELEMKADYPYSGKTRIEVLSSSVRKPKSVQMFVPSWTDARSVSCSLNGEKQNDAVLDRYFVTLKEKFVAGDVIELDYGFVVREENAHLQANTDYHRFFYGPLLLGTAFREEVRIGSAAQLRSQGQGRFLDTKNGAALFPVADLTWLPEKESRESSVQILFKR